MAAEPLTTEEEERQVEKLDKEETEDFPGMFSISGTKKKIIMIILTAMTIVFLILNVTMFIVGVMGTRNCPIQPNIPIYLIVAGILGIANKALTSVYFCKDNIPLLQHIWHALLAIEFIWMIIGSYWVYSIYKPNFIQAPKTPYCSKTVYFFAFWLLTSHFIFGMLLMIVSCCIMLGFFYNAATSTAKR